MDDILIILAIVLVGFIVLGLRTLKNMKTNDKDKKDE